jgi:predicted outer membrane protein
MNDSDLRKLIERLQIEIKNTKTADPNDQEMLVQLEAAIREFLVRADGDKVQYHPTAVRRLEDGLHHFESTHPTLTKLISQLLEGLSNAGI